MSFFKPQTVLNSLWPSLTIIWVFGSASIGVKRAWRISYALIMSVITLYVNLYPITSGLSSKDIMISYLIPIVIYLKILATLVLIWLWELKGVRAVENSILELTKLDEELKNFGLQVNHKLLLWKQLVTIGSAIALFLSAAIIQQSMMIGLYDLPMLRDSFSAYLLITLSSHMQHFQSMLADLVFVMMLEAFRTRFKLVNEIFKRIAESEDRIKVKVLNTSYSHGLDITGRKFQDRREKRNLSPHLVMERVDRACRIHRRLLKVAQDVGDALSLHLCANYPIIFLNILLAASTMVLFLSDTQKVLHGRAGLMITILIVSRFLKIVVTCSNIREEANKLGTSLYRVSIDDAAVHNQLQEHSVYIVQRKLRFTAGGIFVVDYNFANSVFSAVMKYMIVLLQFQKKLPTTG